MNNFRIQMRKTSNMKNNRLTCACVGKNVENSWETHKNHSLMIQ